ncbi:MAG: SDR family oxidoreductase [Spirochaetia bacterium]|jgi:NAD(P)-dependent dehydrogenase (short-subunit alcohol dehydrogenase family)
MVAVDLRGKTALITGGTRGIGLASALALAEAGAQVFLTYKWGSAGLDEVAELFTRAGALRPGFFQADASVEEDTDRLMAELAGTAQKIDVFISNVSFALRTNSLEDYRKRSLFKTLEYSTWPLVDYTRRIKARFGSYPRYILGISSDGPDHYYRGYDFVAASKALMEFFSRYLAAHLFPEGSRVNVLRFGTVDTESFRAVFGQQFFSWMRENGVPAEAILTPKECGKAVLAMCSGLMDAINGQIISVDYGLPFKDNSMMRYLSQESERSGQ